MFILLDTCQTSSSSLYRSSSCSPSDSTIQERESPNLASDPILFTAELFTSIGVVLAAAIFGRLAIKSKNYGSFQFQVSIFILFWAASELPHIFGTTGLIDETSYTTIGLAFHFVS